ncbi:hypothetical protein ACFPMF_10300 [Larkinella bovis]|uniref:Uncharacterized protein n=1 Tax=Larkinella bovis TaxID=683041 RepID=A0ABW0IAY4_9BACT
MKTCFRNVFYALIATLLFNACSRPYATYQKMPVEHFASQKRNVATTLPVETVAEAVTPEAVLEPSTPSPTLTTVATTPSPAAEVAKAQQAVDQVVASSTNKVVNNKLQKSMARIQAMLGSSSDQKAEQAKVARKHNLAERLMLKNVDKKIKRALAPHNPNAPKAVNIIVTIGALVALIGLVVLLATTSDAIGTTLLLVGLILLLVGLIV